MNSWVFQFLRFLHVAIFGFTAIGKLLDVAGFALVIKTYSFGLPEGSLIWFAVGVSLAELALAASLVMNRRPVLNAGFCILAHFGYLMLALITLWRGLDLQNCGCFGVFFARPLTWQTPVEDAVLLTFSLVFWWTALKLKDGPNYSSSSRIQKT